MKDSRWYDDHYHSRKAEGQKCSDSTLDLFNSITTELPTWKKVIVVLTTNADIDYVIPAPVVFCRYLPPSVSR